MPKSVRKKTFSHSGAVLTMTKSGQFYNVKLLDNFGLNVDMVICDSYKIACEYWKAFTSIGKNLSK